MSIKVTLRSIMQSWNPSEGKPLPTHTKSTSPAHLLHINFLASILPDCYKNEIELMSTSEINGLLQANRISPKKKGSPVGGFTKTFIQGLSHESLRSEMFQKIISDVTAKQISSDHKIFVDNQFVDLYGDTDNVVLNEYKKVKAVINSLCASPTNVNISYAIFLLIVSAIVQDNIKQVSFLYAEHSLRAVYDYQYDGKKFIETLNRKHGPFYDPNYFDHSYHVYMYRESTGELWENCMLRMNFEDGQPLATLTLADKPTPSNRNASCIEKVYIGIPILSQEDKTIYIAMADKKDTFAMLSIPYQYFRSSRMYYRSGFLINAEPTSRLPRIQKVVITAQEVHTEDIPYIKGILKIDNNPICISEAQLTTFKHKFANYSWMSDFNNSYIPNFFCQGKNFSGYYTFNAEEILYFSKSTLGNHDRLRLLLALKSVDSLSFQNSSKFIVCEDYNDTHSLFKYSSPQEFGDADLK